MLFCENGFTAQADSSESETVPYSDCACIIEAEDVFLLTFRGQAMLLSKENMISGDTEGFGAFISAKIKYAVLEELT